MEKDDHQREMGTRFVNGPFQDLELQRTKWIFAALKGLAKWR